MRQMSFGSLRSRLLLLVLLAILPALVLIVYTAVENRREALDRAEGEVLRVTRLAAADQTRTIDGARQLLAILAQLPAVRASDPTACNDFLADIQRQYPLYANLGVIERHGVVSCSATSLSGAVSLADRPFFREVLQTGDFAVGDYEIDRITRTATVSFGSPVLEDGRVVRVVYAALDLDWLNQFAAEAQLPSGSTLTVIDRNGRVLVHYPETEGFLGRSIAGDPLSQAIADSDDAVIEVEGNDGVDRLYAFAPLGGAGSVADARLTVGTPVEAVVGDADRALVRNLVWLGLVALLAVVAAWAGSEVFFLRRVDAIGRAMQRLSNGDLSARTGLRYGHGELSHLARSFDDMATRLERSQDEQRAARHGTP